MDEATKSPTSQKLSTPLLCIDRSNSTKHASTKCDYTDLCINKSCMSSAMNTNVFSFKGGLSACGMGRVQLWQPWEVKKRKLKGDKE